MSDRSPQRRKPQIGLLGIMQELYDDMIPAITEHQARYASELAQQLGSVAEVQFDRPARGQADIEAITGDLLDREVDGIAIVMLTYGPAMRSLHALVQASVPLLLANVQPQPTVTADWDMDTLTYNQGIHGAQDQANALVRAGRAFSVLTGDWRSERFIDAFSQWARAAAAITALKRTRIALLGYPMNGMGDICYDSAASTRRLGPTIANEDLGGVIARIDSVAGAQVDELVDRHATIFELADDLPRERHAYAARFELALREMIAQGQYAGFSFHFDALGGDGRFRQLPLLAASDLMADGYGFAAEGDTLTATLMCAAQTMIGDAHFSEMYAMDWPRDAVLISHMGEGNWKLARQDRPVRLIDRPLGIGRLDNPPTLVFSAAPGAATTAALAALEGDRFRLVVAGGEVLDTAELPHVPMHHFHFSPHSGLERFLDRWLGLGAPHHFVINLGDHAGAWRRFAELLKIEYAEI